MPIYHREVAQYSEQYDKLKLGIPTSSNFFRIVSPTGKKSKQWLDYAHHLLAERWYQRRDHTYTSPHMERGLREEEFAVDWYAYDKGLQPGDPDFPALIGFITDDARTMGCTPDRLVGEDGLVELKCPAAPAQFGYLLQGLNDTFKPQLQGQLLISQRVWVDNVAWHDDLPKTAIRVERDDRFAKLLETELGRFVDYLENSWSAIQSKLEPGRPLEIPTSRPRQGPSAQLKAQLEASLAQEDEARSAATVEAQTEVVGDRPMPEVLPHREPGKTSAPLPRSCPYCSSSMRRDERGWYCSDPNCRLHWVTEPADVTPQPGIGGGGPSETMSTDGPPSKVWRCECGEEFEIYGAFSRHRQRTGHKAPQLHNPASTDLPPGAAVHRHEQRSSTIQASREADTEETFWDIAAHSGDYKVEIPDKNIATLGRDQLMNLVADAPTVAAIVDFCKANQERIQTMARARKASFDEFSKACERRNRELGEE